MDTNTELFTASTSNRTGPTQLLTPGQHKHFRELVRDATTLDRHILSTELLAVKVQSGEATDNSNKVSTRLKGQTVRYIERFSADYGVTPSALVREAIEFAINNNLFSTWHELPEHVDEDHE
jgi:hypothetical protein